LSGGGEKLPGIFHFAGNNGLIEPFKPLVRGEPSRWRRRIPMELILVVALVFGGGGVWGRVRGHW